MTSKARWLVGIAMVTALVAVSMGFAAAQGGQTSPTTGGMMGDGSTTGGMMGNGPGTMMAGTDMDAMHDQMMGTMAGTVPADLLAQCDALHDQMMAATSGNGSTSADHDAHHPSTGDTA